eukprot:3941314-Rhodomonas_salina.1
MSVPHTAEKDSRYQYRTWCRMIVLFQYQTWRRAVLVLVLVLVLVPRAAFCPLRPLLAVAPYPSSVPHIAWSRRTRGLGYREEAGPSRSCYAPPGSTVPWVSTACTIAIV